MRLRTFLWGAFWTLIALAVVFHVGLGWYFSGVLIEDGFTPNPGAILVPSGDYQLEEVIYESPLGPMEAWYLPAGGTTWVIHVHGKGATPAEAEPLFAPLQDAGYPQLSITYRNDEGAQLDPSGYYQYGDTEWEDLAGAVDFARSEGAEQVVLSGFSTGASIVMSFKLHRALDAVAGFMMDSANIDFGDTVDYRALQRELPVIGVGVPPTLAPFAKFFTSLRIDVNWQALDYIDKADLIITEPALLHHGTEDESVPVRQSIALAEAKPDLVRLIQVPGAAHVESYDVDRDAYVSEVLSFLASLG